MFYNVVSCATTVSNLFDMNRFDIVCVLGHITYHNIWFFSFIVWYIIACYHFLYPFAPPLLRLH